MLSLILAYEKLLNNKPKTKGEILAEMLEQYENGEISKEEFKKGVSMK